MCMLKTQYYFTCISLFKNFRDMLRKAVNEQVAAMMVLPNKFPVQLIQDVPLKSLKFSPPAVSTFLCFSNFVILAELSF